tara:strand:+ start:7063 stop:8283 length:1221 start_codon:yes stop_codon:yes gene_type:complete
MNKDKFQTIIRIKAMKPPGAEHPEINEWDYSTRSNISYKYVSYTKRLVCTDYDNLFNYGKYNPQENDKLFFSAGCTIPRTKVREWGKDKKISITTKPEKANVNIISLKWLRNLSDYHSQYYDCMLDKQNFIDFLEINYSDKEFLDELITEIKSTSFDKVIISKYNSSNMTGYNYNRWSGESKPMTDAFKYENEIVSTYVDLFGESEFKSDNEDFRLIDQSEQKIKNLNKLFDLNDSNVTIFDTDLIDYVNESAITIDDEMYKQLYTMLDSDDKKNHIIAMEIIANCNYRTSLYKVLLLFKEVGWKVYNRPEKNHVNFKSLIKFIDLNDWSNPEFDSIISSLMDKKYLTKEILEEIMPLVKKEILEQNDFRNIFKINTITVSNEVKRYFGVDVELSKEELKQLEENE